jgi:hypothetical protein
MQRNGHKRPTINRIAPDLSAILIIAFVFQVLFPIIVFETGSDKNADFIAQLRNSICYANLNETSSSEAPLAPNVPGFFCDKCVVTSLDHCVGSVVLPTTITYHVDVVKISNQASSEIAFLFTQHNIIATAPRAPPIA